MQRKLKSVFRRSSKSRRSADQNEHLENKGEHSKATTPHEVRGDVTANQRGRKSEGSSTTGSVHTGHSRPASSISDDLQHQAHKRHALTDDVTTTSGSDGGNIANDYKAYLPVLSPVKDEHGPEYITPVNGDKSKDKVQNGIEHIGVADSNVARYNGNGATNGSNVLPGTAKVNEKPRVADLGNTASGLQPRAYAAQEPESDILPATMDGTVGGEETALAKRLRESGVADLRSTVDTDGEVTWAPAVTHEVVKPHRHEIIQHKIYREIHNYEHFHRIQPVMMTEVLPPRHWIPNPDGEGLIEISADELPARTGENRWWSICEHSTPHTRQNTMPKYRTEPEIIEKGTYITEGGFERKETIIIHPPTLADLTGYGGPVQAMHFDHKTGKSWMGELTTMDKLQELQQELDRVPDARAFKMDGLAESLPKVSSGATRRESNSVPLRKPVNGHTSIVHS